MSVASKFMRSRSTGVIVHRSSFVKNESAYKSSPIPIHPIPKSPIFKYRSQWADALVLSYVLAQCTDATFFLSNGKFELLVKTMDSSQVPGTEHFKQERDYLRKITQYVFDFTMQAIVFSTSGIHNLVA
jgi:hypothetical protein